MGHLTTGGNLLPRVPKSRDFNYYRFIFDIVDNRSLSEFATTSTIQFLLLILNVRLKMSLSWSAHSGETHQSLTWLRHADMKSSFNLQFLCRLEGGSQGNWRQMRTRCMKKTLHVKELKLIILGSVILSYMNLQGLWWIKIVCHHHYHHHLIKMTSIES